MVSSLSICLAAGILHQPEYAAKIQHADPWVLVITPFANFMHTDLTWSGLVVNSGRSVGRVNVVFSPVGNKS